MALERTVGKGRGKGRGKSRGRGSTSKLVDEGLKARWVEAITRYRRARAEETAGWDERWEALGEILESEPPLYLAGGYGNAGEFLKAEAPEQDVRG